MKEKKIVHSVCNEQNLWNKFNGVMEFRNNEQENGIPALAYRNAPNSRYAK